ncbi:hypothetical protein ACFOWA_19400 [Pedobacter lithocola]|uniref:TerB family tellurite resistance protein n=1 Tax=Pedobacter lithocola TaxID=1908239 RepID=A0ABV8PGQ9_9SPHI
MGSRIRVFGLMVALLFITSLSYGQTYSEFFRQKKTQEKYLLKQLAYLKMYAGYLKKGYDVVSDGLSTIKGFTSGEFGLHEAFFGSLKMVSPVIKQNYRVIEIISMQVKISKMFADMAFLDIGNTNLNYLRTVNAEIHSECNKDLDELILIITASKVEMSDDERLIRLAKVHSSMSEKTEFSLGLYAEVEGLSKAQKNEKSEIIKMRRLYEKN